MEREISSQIEIQRETEIQRGRDREHKRELEVGKVYKISKPTYNDIFPLAKIYLSIKFPNSTTNWEKCSNK